MFKKIIHIFKAVLSVLNPKSKHIEALKTTVDTIDQKYDAIDARISELEKQVEDNLGKVEEYKNNPIIKEAATKLKNKK